MQKGEGSGIDSIEERDRDAVLADPHNTIINHPQDRESMTLIHVFHQTQFEYGMNGLQGFNYIALKDSIKWIGLKPKTYVPFMQACMNKYLSGISRR